MDLEWILPCGTVISTDAKHVIIADDYADSAEGLALLLAELSSARLSVEVGFTGAEALAMAIIRPPDAAILDIEMPVMDGIDAALAIRAALPQAQPLLIAMTGDPGQAAAMRTHLVFDHVLTKPIDIDGLLALLDRRWALERD